MSNNGVTATCNVTVNPYLVTKITLDKIELELTENTREKLTATVLPENATNQNVKWTSSNSSVAIVSQDGTVTAVSSGYANIIATSMDGSDVSASCLVHVVKPAVLAEGISLNNSKLDLTTGDEYSLAATIEPSYVSSNDVSWLSSNPSVATVSNTGKVTAVGYGQATITATTTDGTNLSAECKVTVKPQDVSSFDNIIFFEEALAVTGKTMSIPLKMNNTAAISAVQFDIFMPEGITIDASGVTFNEDAERADASTHTLSCSLQSNGAYRVLSYSGSSIPFADNSGTIFDIPVTVAEGVESGEYYILMKDIVLTDKNGVQYSIDTYGSPLRVTTCTPGDANGDGKINVSDIVTTANIILGNASSSAIVEAADMNGDGKVNVTDIVKIANYILGGGSSNAPRRSSPAKAMAKRSGNALDILPFTIEEAGVGVTVTLDLHNPKEEFTAFQCDITLPEGITIATKRSGVPNVTFNAEAERYDDHTISCSQQKNGDYTFLSYSTNSIPYYDNDGALVNIPLKTSEDLEDGVYEFVVKNIVLTQADETEIAPADYYGSIIVGNGGEIQDIQLHGYYTKAVLSEFSTALSENSGVTSIDLTEAVDVETKGSLTTGNPNTLVYLAEDKTLTNAQNLVIGDQCESLVLTDAQPFCAPKAFTAATASYSRTLASDGWYSLCLPFAATAPAGVTVERFEQVDASKGLIYFAEGAMEADKPCIFNTTAGTLTFSATNAPIAATPATLADGDFTGTYTLLPAGTITGRYALHADGRGFGTASATAFTQPFRALLSTAAPASYLALRHNGGIATAITLGDGNGSQSGASLYNLGGQRVQSTHKGIVVTNGKKVLTK